jgi:hypothetical protein
MFLHQRIALANGGPHDHTPADLPWDARLRLKGGSRDTRSTVSSLR